MCKKSLYRLLIAALMVGLGMNVTSCKDDDEDDKRKEEQQKELTQQKTDAFWDVVGQLVSTSDYTTDYQNATFEPVYGIADDTNPLVRIVNTNDMETAAYRFATLVGLSADDAFPITTQTYTWSNDEAGTLVYHKTDNGKSWAEVDVNIKQLPRLQKIIYQAPEQAGNNGTFEGTAYYRFGDVVERIYADPLDGYGNKREYWICVRPPVGPAGKQDSHWVSLSQPPKANIYTWESDTDFKKVSLPTGIGKNEEHMQNFAELLFAIANSEEWSNNLKKADTPHPKMWHDFKPERYALNNKTFFDRVRNNWINRRIFKTIFGNTYDISGNKPAEKLSEMLKSRTGLNLLYKGYSWPWGWMCTLYNARFTNGTGKKSNMHDLKYINIKKDLSALDTSYLNVGSVLFGLQPYLCYSEFFGDNACYFIIRHATGKELAGFKPSVYESLHNKNNGIVDYYNYNMVHNINNLKNTRPEILEE